MSTENPEDRPGSASGPAADAAANGGAPGDAPPPDPGAPPRAPRRRMLGRLARALGGMLALLVALVALAGGALYAAVHYESGTRLAWRGATVLLGARLGGTFEGGTLAHGVRLRNVFWRSGGTDIELDRLAAQWQLNSRPWRFTLDYLRIGTLETRFAPAPATQSSTGLPKDLTLPLQLDIREVRVDHIVLHQGAVTTRLNDLVASGSSDGRHHQLTLQSLQTEYGDAFVALKLDGVRPFALSGSARFDGRFSQQAVQASAQLSGSLEFLKASVDATGMKLAGHAYVEALPFGAVPLKVVQLSADHIDPRSFSPSAPGADLSLRAQLQPVAGAPGTGAGLVAAGTVSIVNAHPGTIDQKLLPLVDAHAQMRLDAHAQSITGLTVHLLNNATLTGAGTLAGQQGRLDLRVDKLDLHALQASLRPTQLAGPITIALAGARQTVRTDLADPKAALRAQAAVTLEPAQVSLDNVKLTLGKGRAELKGALKRDARQSYALKATLTDFDPLALMSEPQPGRGAPGKTARQAAKHRAASPGSKRGGSAESVGSVGGVEKSHAASQKESAGRGKAIQASVSGTFDATGALAPGFSTKTVFTLRDSVYDGLPLTGGGVIQLAGMRLLPSNARLAVAGNDIALQGSFGGRGDRLRFQVDAPALAQLGFGLGGALKADGDLTGSLAHPNASANYQADNVVFGGDRIGHAAGRAEFRDGANGALVLTAEARDVTAAQLALKTVSIDLHGTRAAHSLTLAANGTALGYALDLNLAARGGLADTAAGMSWKGTVNTLENRGLPAVKLLNPVALSVGPGSLSLGATHLTLERATLNVESLLYDHGRIRSSGTLSNLAVDRLLQINQEVTGQPPPLHTDLILDGAWNFSLAQTATGYLEIKRRSGDVSIDAGQGVVALGLTDLDARADFAAGNRLQATLRARAARLGTLDAQVQAALSPSDGLLTLAGTAPLSGSIRARVPSLATTGSLLGPSYLLGGKLALDLALAGQLEHPSLSGTFTGDDLSATLVDQGLQLKQGIVRLALSENLLDFQQVEFHGASGVLSATGKIRLDQADPNLNAHIVADKLELFAAPDRQLSLSGSATVANGGAAGGIDIDGKFTVDHALFDLPESAAPQLGDDVVIVRPDGSLKGAAAGAEAGAKLPGQAASDKPAGRFAPRANVAINLGRNFRFRGAGADLGLLGTVTAHSAPDEPLRAVGNVRVTQGSTYTSFGRKLAIENGFFTFNGPVSNPGINILAMRRNQEVEAGVQVTGTLQSPNVRLVSEPNVPDNEKLSWLLFGHGTDQGNNLGQQSTMTAALALLGNAGSKRIAQTIGLDEFSVGTSEVGLTDPQVVMVSKAINERLVLGYEQGLTSAGNVLKATVNLSRFWAVTAYAGTLNGLDLLFNRRFDGARKRRKQ